MTHYITVILNVIFQISKMVIAAYVIFFFLYTVLCIIFNRIANSSKHFMKKRIQLYMDWYKLFKNTYEIKDSYRKNQRIGFEVINDYVDMKERLSNLDFFIHQTVRSFIKSKYKEYVSLLAIKVETESNYKAFLNQFFISDYIDELMEEALNFLVFDIGVAYTYKLSANEISNIVYIEDMIKKCAKDFVDEEKIEITNNRLMRDVRKTVSMAAMVSV